VGIIGDVMLDTYMWGYVERISPEAPVPIVSLEKKEQRIGGAGNVALNIQSAGAQAYVISVTGNDAEADILKELFTTNHISTQYIVQSSQRITTNKIRIIGRNQQMMRLDAEATHDLTTEEEQQLLTAFEQFVTTEKPQVVIIEDYNKGVLTPNVINSVIAICKSHHIITAVDPKKKNFFAYKGVDIFKPNLKEVKEGLNISLPEVNKEQLQTIHQQLHEKLQHHISFITLSEKGVFYQNNTQSAIVPSHLRNIADVSGAGDTVIAVASLIYAATGNIPLMAKVANIAGGLVCEEVGTAAINKQKLLNECKLLLS
jgi:rfaE bifunctional protein kinase chain/domain